ncbi:MAG TPA: hypothetical protein VHW09_27050 [Bryobacteraceae bacterium]|jgi:hypothetical protein|nr:hypothetical protein [Bryobacteraceae bacterium]
MQSLTHLLHAWLNRPSHHALQEHTHSLADETPEIMESLARVAARAGVDGKAIAGHREWSSFTPPEGRA